MNALILSCGTGGGHNSAATAIEEQLISDGHTATVLNPYTLHSRQLAERINQLYIKTVQKAPTVFGAAYKVGELYRKLPGRSPVYFANRGMIPAMEDFLSRETFDVIITTHLFPAEILTFMKQKEIPIPKTIFVATDYECIPFTEETDCDAYVIPLQKLEQAFIDRGIPKSKLYPLGIPVRSEFSKITAKQDACLCLGLDPGKKYVLAAGGSMGGGSIRKLIQMLAHEVMNYESTELIVLCGSNRHMYDELLKDNLPRVRLVGFTSDMPNYLKASEIFITKPGGLSSTEAAVCGIPIIHVAPIPGCETINASFFSSNGMSIFCRDTRAELASALRILSDKAERDKMLFNQKNLICADAAVKIEALALSLAQIPK